MELSVNTGVCWYATTRSGRMVQQFDRGAGQGCWPEVSVAGHWQNGAIGGTHVAVNRRWE